MKKRLLILMNNMRIGGVEKSLLNLLQMLDPNKFDVTILFMRKDGGYLNQIPSWVKIEEVELSHLERDLVEFGPKKIIREQIKQRNILMGLRFLFFAMKRKATIVLRSNKQDRYRVFFDFLPAYKGHFDIALDFHNTTVTTYYISDKVDADKRATWIHSSEFGDVVRDFRFCYEKYDRIFAVSQACTEKFICEFPEFSEKVDTFYNIILNEEIRKKAEEGSGFMDEYQGLRIVTVGRLSAEKGFDLAIEAAAKLKKEGHHFRWYIIGEGVERTSLEQKIRTRHLEDCFILLGAMVNPYPYIQQCDIYVQPSRYEGYCLALAEARILNKPLVTTDFFGAQEQIINGKTGIIVPVNREDLFEAIKKLITDSVLRKQLTVNLTKEQNENGWNMEKLFQLIEHKQDKVKV